MMTWLDFGGQSSTIKVTASDVRGGEVHLLVLDFSLIENYLLFY